MHNQTLTNTIYSRLLDLNNEIFKRTGRQAKLQVYVSQVTWDALWEELSTYACYEGRFKILREEGEIGGYPIEVHHGAEYHYRIMEIHDDK